MNETNDIGTKDNPIFISSQEEFDALKTGIYYTFLCKKCGVSQCRKKLRGVKKQSSLRRLLCINCSHIETNQQRYSVDNPFQSEIFKSKSKETCLQKYGVEYASQSSIFKDKVISTCLEKYGETTNLKCEDTKQKIKNTNIKKYGVENVSQSEEIQSKKEETFYKHYGVKHGFQSEEVKTKIENTIVSKYGVSSFLKTEDFKLKSQQTCLEKYGTPFASQSEIIKDKQKQTFLKKYGVENPSKLEKINQKKKETLKQHYGVSHVPSKYIVVDNISFDSKWEVVFYIYYRDKGSNIKREPLELYYYYNNIKHAYIPDFEIDGQLYEIKGDHFFKNGTMCNPYNHKLDGLAEAKYLCIVENNVNIITSKEMKPYFKYVKNTYGLGFLKNL